MAAAYYNKLTGTNNAKSAGTEVDVPGETLQERYERIGRPTNTIDVMKGVGIDAGGFRRTQLTESMLDKYDLVISMTQKEYTPTWLSANPKYRFWNVEDPGGRGYESTKSAFNEIRPMVQELIEEID